MKKAFLTILLTVLVLAPAAAQTYDELCTLAEEAAAQDSLSLAEDCIRRALRLEPADPRNAMLFSNLGTIQRRQGRLEFALESYGMALNLAPLSVPILMNHATVALELGHDDTARADCSQALELQPRNREALLMRAYIYMRSRSYKLARQDYDTLLKAAPQSYAGRLGLATLCRRESKTGEALRVLDAMLADSTAPHPFPPRQLAEVYVTRAAVELDMLRSDLALADLSRALSLDPAQAEAYLMRGRIRLSQKRKREARRDFGQAVALGVPPGEVRDLLRCAR